jgi:hypothetical protein
MPYENSPLAAVAKGAVAGLVGTAVLTSAMPRTLATLRTYDLVPPEAPVPPTTEEAAEKMEQPPRKLTERVATGVLETDLSDETERAAGQAIHWGYGAAWGAFFGLMQGSLRLPFLLHGFLFGGLVGLAASTVVPALGLTPPPRRQPGVVDLTQFELHALYGCVTALTFHLLGGER